MPLQIRLLLLNGLSRHHICFKLHLVKLGIETTFFKQFCMDGKGRKVLIADDEPDIIEILKYNLEKEGYSVISAKDGDEALEKARLTQPELIVLDMMMPKKNGMRGMLDGSVRLPLAADQSGDFGTQPSDFAGVRRMIRTRPKMSYR